MTQKDGAAKAPAQPVKEAKAEGPTVGDGVGPERWVPFTEAEQLIIRECVREFVDRILHQAGEGVIEDQYREDAALTMLGAANVMCELDEARGDATPNYEVFAMSAQLISNGRYAETLKEMSQHASGVADDDGK